MDLRESLSGDVSEYMSKDYAEVDVDDSITDAAKKMKNNGATEALVLSKGIPVGIVTERDILYKVVAAGSSPAVVKVHDIMSSPVETIDDSSKVGDAIARMSRLGIRRLGVTRSGRIVGMVTQKAMVSGNVRQSVLLPELAPPEVLICPYCGAVTKSKEELSVHIDHTHMGGLGLLQGDVTKW
jgi:signal-transduction protein with cAMP-binding, CBS, and nucleotidyltransferase domain